MPPYQNQNSCTDSEPGTKSIEQSKTSKKAILNTDLQTSFDKARSSYKPE